MKTDARVSICTVPDEICACEKAREVLSSIQELMTKLHDYDGEEVFLKVESEDGPIQEEFTLDEIQKFQSLLATLSTDYPSSCEILKGEIE
jgi:predicted AlkP superfamily pyrophosphatase or phosphodiesterase